MGTLNAALSWASRGFQVFPLYENSKEPAIDDFPNFATTDEAAIRQWWTDPVLRTERNYNIGCLCSDYVVIDIDVKEGKDGYNEYAQVGGDYDTLVVQTPTGGFHCYFYGPDSSNSPISKSVDVRSHNGYVLAPGSVVDGRSYQVVEDRPLKWVPASVERLLTPAYKKNEDLVVDFERDTEANINAAMGYLQSCPPAIMGERGDDVTFKTAARIVNEMGLTTGTAFALLRDYYNPRCVPPWPLDELLAKVENAASYGTAMAGRLTPEVTFASVPQIPPPPKVFEQNDIRFGNALSGQEIPPRPWLVDRMLMKQNITLLLAAGSTGKSSISLALAAHLAQGRDFAGYKSHSKCKTIVYNGEDDLHEQSRRLSAICIHHGLEYKDIKEEIMLLSPDQVKMTLAKKEQYNRVRDETLVEHLIDIAKAPDVGLLVLDPLVKIHHMDEVDNVDMDFVMETLTYIARKADVAILALHHSTKTNTRQENRIGNMDVARGASAIVNAARIAFTLLNPSETDMEMYGFEDKDAHKWVRLDDAKMNMSLSNDKATWFKKDGLRIPSGDIVGVLHHEKVEKTTDHLLNIVSRFMHATFLANNQSTINAQEAVNIVKTNIPLMANKRDKEIRMKLEGLFKFGHSYDGQVIKAVRDGDKLLFTYT